MGDVKNQLFMEGTIQIGNDTTQIEKDSILKGLKYTKRLGHDMVGQNVISDSWRKTINQRSTESNDGGMWDVLEGNKSERENGTKGEAG